jgi:hypothetical protein
LLVELGAAGLEQARATYQAHGLADSRRGALGLALQRRFERADRQVLDAGWESAAGTVAIDDAGCDFRLMTPRPWGVTCRY